jgi:hypothetical protein
MLFAHISEGIAYSNHFDYYGEGLSHEKASLIPATISPRSRLAGVSISGEESLMWPSAGYQCSLNTVCNWSALWVLVDQPHLIFHFSERIQAMYSYWHSLRWIAIYQIIDLMMMEFPDFIQVYQQKGQTSIGCSPPNYHNTKRHLIRIIISVLRHNHINSWILVSAGAIRGWNSELKPQAEVVYL